MRLSGRFLTVLLILLISSQVIPTQQRNAKQTVQTDPNIDLLTFQILHVTEVLMKDSQSFMPLERAVLWTRLGDVLWKDDREQGRRMLVKAVDEIEIASNQKKSISEPQIQKEQLVNTTRTVLRIVSARDKQLSERLLKTLSHLGDEKQSGTASQSDSIADALVDSALLVLNTPKIVLPGQDADRFEDTVPKNPVRKVKFLAEDNEQVRVLTSDEEKLYLLAASQPLRDIATMMLETGMRPDEVCRIGRENVHLDQGYLFNPFGKTKAGANKLRPSVVLAAIKLT